MKKLVPFLLTSVAYLFCVSNCITRASYCCSCDQFYRPPFNSPQTLTPSKTKPSKIVRSKFQSSPQNLRLSSSLDSSDDLELYECIDLLSPCDSPILFSPDIYQNLMEIIRNEEDFIKFANAVNSGYDYKNKMVILEADLDLESFNWIPIGNLNCPFNGLFEGNQHKINLGPEINCLFAYAKDAEIYNVNLIGSQTILLKSDNVRFENCFNIFS